MNKNDNSSPTSVGMAIGQKWLASRYNQPGFDIVDYHIYAVCGDGCMMEGVASEAASLAGRLGLDNLCWVYDNNRITIGYGSPDKQDTPEAHGEPLGDDEVRLAKRSYGWPEDAKFLVPSGVRLVGTATSRFSRLIRRGWRYLRRSTAP
jgi:transketolase